MHVCRRDDVDEMLDDVDLQSCLQMHVCVRSAFVFGVSVFDRLEQCTRICTRYSAQSIVDTAVVSEYYRCSYKQHKCYHISAI